MLKLTIHLTLLLVLHPFFSTALPAAESKPTISPQPPTSSNDLTYFEYRFYRGEKCDHNAAANDTDPENDLVMCDFLAYLLERWRLPYDTDIYTRRWGHKQTCYSAPLGLPGFLRVEISQPITTLITFCKEECQGSGSILQGRGWGGCHEPFPGCLLGSL
ncbi:hypothetical protein QBC36DRAFT_313626 [Triangularia setosa]|uniref:Uncharacterized protein n=1 Tax=Triangularia setosa TaxID=2587417 RepID=A0AAN6W1K1_9PEZI|nr:hypothetical protein QBC36DRAFT_313626 [Podospora setosa]